MGKTTKTRARQLRTRAELGRLRAAGGLTKQIVVDGAGLLDWCERVEKDFSVLVAELVAEATDGGRQVVLVSPPTAPTVKVPAPHVVVPAAVGVAGLLRTRSVSQVDLNVRPDVISADVDRHPELLDVLRGGASHLVDIATGRLWDRGDNKYDTSFVAQLAEEAASLAASDGETLARIVANPQPARTDGRVYIAVQLHRDQDAVVLDEVRVEGRVRRSAEKHGPSLALIAQTLAQTTSIPVITSSMEVLDALHDAGHKLREPVEDPALACVLLDPDERTPPPGVGGMWARLLSTRRDEQPIRPSLDRTLDELPGLHLELRGALQREGLLSLYDDDISPTLPLFAAMEREGFHVDATGLSADIAFIDNEMKTQLSLIISGSGAADFRNADLLHGDNGVMGALIEKHDGKLPGPWRGLQQPDLDRYALHGNPRAIAIQRLRALNNVHEWMKTVEAKSRLRSLLEPTATGRWVPHGEALATIPKREPEAMRLRKHLVPEPGHVFVAGDFSAFEPRLLAHQSHDTVLAAACSPALDIYTHLMPLLGVSDRDIVKKALLAFMYGQSPKTFARKLPLPLPDGYRVYEDLERALHGACVFRDLVKARDKTSSTCIGGWRRLRGRASAKKFERRALNLQMQGSAAYLLRRLIRTLSAVLPPGCRVVHQEFDAVVITCPVTEMTRVKGMLARAMEGVASLNVPLVAKLKDGATLADVS